MNRFALLPRLLAVILALVVSSACRSPAEVVKSAVPVRSTMDEATKLAAAEAILEDLMVGLKQGDHQRFAARHTAERREQITPENFTKMAEAITADLGECQSREYLGRLDKQTLEVFLWKAKFSKNQEEVLIRLMLGEIDGQYQVFSFGIAPY